MPRKKKRNQPAYIKGPICGILPLSFLTEFVGLPSQHHWRVRRLLWRWTKEREITQKEMSADDLRAFIDYVDQYLKGKQDDGEIDDYLAV